MPANDDLGVVINPELDQHFLSNPAKLARIIEAAAIRQTDQVVEVGAGIGTVAEHIPTVRSLTVIEYDANLTAELARRVPHATVIQGDAIAILPTLPVDVLLSNLPSYLTAALIKLVPHLPFRVALLTVPTVNALASLAEGFTIERVTVLEPNDFRPRQASPAHVVRVVRAGALE